MNVVLFVEPTDVTHVLVDEPTRDSYQVIVTLTNGWELWVNVRDLHGAMNLVEKLGATDRLLYHGRSWSTLHE